MASYTSIAPAYDALSGEWPVYRRGRRAGIALLRPRPGDTVLDLGCGTGLNLAPLRAAVGPTGLLIGVDRSPSMLRVARRRADRHRWGNVALVEADATAFTPADLDAAAGRPVVPDAVLATYALSLMPRWRDALAAARAVARPGARVCVVDLALPRGPLRPLARLACAAGGADPRRHPWEGVERDARAVTGATLWAGHVEVRAGTWP